MRDCLPPSVDFCSAPIINNGRLRYKGQTAGRFSRSLPSGRMTAPSNLRHTYIYYDIHIILYREVCCRFVREAARIVPELSGWYRMAKEESKAKGKGNTRLPGTNFLKMLYREHPYIVEAPV